MGPLLIEKPRIPFKEILLFGLWPNALKILIYRLRGYKIGKGVKIGPGSVVCGDHEVEIGDYTTIGFLTIVRGKNIRIGSFVKIGSMTFLDCPNTEIGEGSKINEQVFVGGLQDHDSFFKLGRNCQIMQMSFINPARSIVVGDDSGIGGNCSVFGHTSWLSQFEGYAVDFAPIEIGKSVSVAWGVFLLPGTKIGDGSVVGAQSVVHGTVPPQSMAIGFPARIIARAPDFPKPVTDDDKVAMFRNIVSEMVGYFVGSELACERQGDLYEIRQPSRGWWQRDRGPMRLKVVEGDPCAAAKNLPAELHVFLSLQEIPADVRKGLSLRGTKWIDIARKEQSRDFNDLGDEVILYLKRYGVRTNRC